MSNKLCLIAFKNPSFEVGICIYYLCDIHDNVIDKFIQIIFESKGACLYNYHLDKHRYLLYCSNK